MEAATESLAQQVHATLLDCLFQDSELVDGKPPVEPVRAPCIMRTFGLHPERLEGHRAKVAGFLRRMQDPFFSDKGAGWSFLQMCETRDGELWAEHRTCDELLALGIGLGMVRFLVPRDVWAALPGGVPYLVIDADAVTAAQGS